MYRIGNFFSTLIVTFCLFAIVFVPFICNLQTTFTSFFFLPIVSKLQGWLFPHSLQNIDFSSDTIALNIMLGLLLLAAFLVTFFATFTKNKNGWVEYLMLFISYYLAFVLLKYGFDKVFKLQFYLPEPNILYSEFGMLTKDILYWSTIGTSRFYNISIGVIELVTAGLILFSRTRTLGLLGASLIFAHIVIINFGFDISVKTYSMLLLLMALVSVAPELKSIYNFFIRRRTDIAIPDLNSCLQKNYSSHIMYQHFPL